MFIALFWCHDFLFVCTFYLNIHAMACGKATFDEFWFYIWLSHNNMFFGGYQWIIKILVLQCVGILTLNQQTKRYCQLFKKKKKKKKEGAGVA